MLGRLRSGVRLLTLTGPAAPGKTRLAIEAAAAVVPDHKAGVFWVGLAALRDPRSSSTRSSGSLGAKDGLAAHIGSAAPAPHRQPRARHRRGTRPFGAARGLPQPARCIVTSRELLRVHGEVEFAVPPLAHDGGRRALLRAGAGRAVRRDRRALRPPRLAAAGRRAGRRPHQGADPRPDPRTARPAARPARLAAATPTPASRRCGATIEWSYDLLSADERQLFRRARRLCRRVHASRQPRRWPAPQLDTLQSLSRRTSCASRTARVPHARDDPRVRR